MEKSLTIDGVKVSYRHGGSGDPIILMHGWGCDSNALKLFERVGLENNTVYNIDLPGFGKSEEPLTPWGIEEYTRMLETFCKKLGIDNPVVLGHSFGGRIAILFASRNKVKKLILVDAAGVKPRRKFKYYLQVYSYKFCKLFFPILFWYDKEKAKNKIEEMRSRRGSYDYRNSSPMMRRVMVKVVNADLRSCMKNIQAPTLLLWGENDTATPLRDARIMLKRIPDSGLISFPGAGHFSFVDNPFQSAAAVRRFLL